MVISILENAINIGFPGVPERGEFKMTKEALAKLSEKSMKYCKTLSCLINRYNQLHQQIDNTKFRGKLRGYLECLRDVNVLTEYEMRGLYLYFIEADRSSEHA